MNPPVLEVGVPGVASGVAGDTVSYSQGDLLIANLPSSIDERPLLSRRVPAASEVMNVPGDLKSVRCQGAFAPS